MIAPVEVLPLVGLVPPQPPEAVQEVAFVVLQTRVAALPLVMLAGLALRVTAGAGAGAGAVVTVTDVVVSLLPPAPLQANAYFAVSVKIPVERLPLVATLPLQLPEAVHEVAFVELQVSVEALPA